MSLVERLLYVDVLYSIMHPVGKCPDTFTYDQQDLYDNVRNAFNMTKEEHTKAVNIAKKRAAPRIVLRVVVFEAKELRGKDAIGTSDPYCVLGIQIDANPRSRKKTAMEILSTKKQYRTCLVEKELNPVWNELFQFEINKPNKDRFLLDIWDSDPRHSVGEAILNLDQSASPEGLRRGAKNLTKSYKSGVNMDEFLGRVSYRVKSIPSVGERAWYPLEGRSPNSDVTGNVRIGFRLSVIKPKVPIALGRVIQFPVDDNCQEKVQKNIDVIETFIKYTVQEWHSTENEKWIGSIVSELLTVIHFHALHNDLSEFQEDVSLWTAYTQQHHKMSMRYSAMRFYLERLQASWDHSCRRRLHKGEVAILHSAFHMFVGDCLVSIFLFRETSQDGQNFYNLLKCLEILIRLDLVHICYPVDNLRDKIEMALIEGTKEWYKNTLQRVKSMTSGPRDVIQSLLNLTLNISGDLLKGNCYYKSKFRMIDIDYEPLTYPLIEKNLVNDIMDAFTTVGGGDRIVVSEIIKFHKNWKSDEELWTSYFKLYIALKEVSSFLEALSPEQRHSPNLSEYHEWFRFQLERWMVMSHEKSLDTIRVAIELDVASPVTSFSSSAVDVSVCLNELSEMVSQIAWPNGCEGYAIGTLVLAMISEGAKLYATLVYDKLKAMTFFGKTGQFDVSDQLYRVINSIEQVRLSLGPQFNKLESLKPLQSSLADIEDSKRMLFLSEIRNRMYKEADSTIVRIIQIVLSTVAEQMKRDLKEKMDTVSSSYLYKDMKETAFGNLSNYLEKNLETLHTNLMISNFDRFLCTLWNILLTIIQDISLKSMRKDRAYFEWMGEVLDRIEAIFHADGDGLAEDVMKSETFIEIKKEILLRGDIAFMEEEKVGGMCPCCS